MYITYECLYRYRQLTYFITWRQTGNVIMLLQLCCRPSYTPTERPWEKNSSPPGGTVGGVSWLWCEGRDQCTCIADGKAVLRVCLRHVVVDLATTTSSSHVDDHCQQKCQRDRALSCVLF